MASNVDSTCCRRACRRARFVTPPGETRPSGQLGKSDRADRCLVGKRGGNGGVIPVDDDGRVEQTDGHLEILIDDVIEVGLEVGKVDMRSNGAESHELFPGDEPAAGPLDRPELGHWDAISRHDEGLPRCHRVDDLCVVVA
jgi:hypothetical protein